ncbi:TRADD-N-associated membrane domain-containing protein [Nocardia cyriacigeorgica]|uniref:TRADD-N-associated membrane domain-containing protein n=1 Tax=Nocardia cyriacigeorgica TaxID=135487 RepID=UPI0024563305|nr:hypothetical protein [Nocardia cyriacigeorgica]
MGDSEHGASLVIPELDQIGTVAELAAALRVARALRGYTFSQLSTETGLPKAVLKSCFNATDSLPAYANYMKILDALGVGYEREGWEQAYARLRSGRIGAERVNVSGRNANVNIFQNSPTVRIVPDAPSAADRRETFLLEFMNQALSQANTTFVLSMLFTALGALIMLGGVGLAIFRPADSGVDYMSVLSSAAGLTISVCGGVFVHQAYMARRHVTRRADLVHQDIRSDRAFERATSLIDKVVDTELRDQIYSITAARALGLNPEPPTAPSRPPMKKIESQRLESLRQLH